MIKAPGYLALAVACLYLNTASAVGLLETYQDALSSDPDLRQAASDRLADRETKPQAKALWLPTIGAGLSAEREFDVDSSTGTSTSTSTRSSSFNGRSVNLQLNQSIYNRANWHRLKQADAVLDQADANFSATEDDLVLRVAQAYFDILSAQDDLTFTLADKNAIARQLEQAEQRFDVGLITITDVQEAQARFDSVSATEIVARNTFENRKEALRRITGKHYEKFDSLGNKMPLELPSPSKPDAWVDLAFANNPLLQSAESGIDVARGDIEIQRSGHYPTVGLVAGYTDSRRDSSDSNGGQIGLQVEIPLFEGFAVSSRTRAAAYRLESAKQIKEQQQRAVVTQVRNAYRGVQASISQIKALKQATVSSASALEATEAGFEVGTRTIVDVLNAQRDLFQAERNYSIARYDYVLNGLLLKQAAGVVDLSDIEQIQGWLHAIKR